MESCHNLKILLAYQVRSLPLVVHSLSYPTQ